jgi:Ca2+-binding RTX toxin-like protein
VDAAGKIWTANIFSSDATRIDPAAGPIGADLVTPVGAFDLAVPLPDANPYNYSDMTGSTLTGKPESGTWTVVYDSGIAGAEWGTASWTAETLGGSQLDVTVETSTDGTTFGSPVTPTNGGELTVADGRYLRATTTYTRGTNEESPVLYDLTLSTVVEDGGDGGDTPSPTTSVSPSAVPTAPPSLLGTCRGHAVTIQTIANQITFGTAANDVINGTSGSDTIYGYGRRDIVCGQGGDDTIYGGGGGGGGLFADRLYGGAGQDRLFGDGGDDTMVGGPGDDFLYGRPGNDGFNGGAGIDACIGGPGLDIGKLCEPFDQ